MDRTELALVEVSFTLNHNGNFQGILRFSQMMIQKVTEYAIA